MITKRIIIFGVVAAGIIFIMIGMYSALLKQWFNFP
jgi:hypothetical protein